MTAWITSKQLADVAGISERKARLALAGAFDGRPWRGVLPVVRRTRAGGGPRGLKYEARVDTLPADFQERFNEIIRPPAPPRLAELTEQRGAEREWWLRILAPLLSLERGSERESVVAALVARRDLNDWRGRPVELSARTVYRRLQHYREQGPLAFAPRARADKGKAKVIISLAAEQSIPFDTETWEDIATDLRNYIRGHWKKGVTLGLLEGRANFKFRELIEQAGFSYSNSVPEKTFIVPRRFIVAERPYRSVHELRSNRKSYEDNRFRTTRSRAHLQPMDWVVFDVHPVDIVMNRDDGSTAHARMIAFQDCATNRLRFKLVLCEAGTGIRNAHMIEAFCEMLDDPTWGMPKTLYLDNGQENNFADKLNDALQLVEQLRGVDGRKTRVVRALPYNAAAKPIEGMFGKLEKNLQDIPGHTGGDRMNKKTERVGRPTKAFAGTLAQLDAIISGRILEMESRPSQGHLNGRSSMQSYTAFIDAGWQPVLCDTREIETVFAEDRVCTINKGVITYQNRNWACHEMAHYFEKKIIARVPLYWTAARLPLLHIKTKEYIGSAEPIGAFAFDDPRGAQLSKQVDKARRAGLRQLERSAPEIDTVKEGLRIAELLPKAPVASSPAAIIGLNRQSAAIAADAAQTPKERTDRQREKNLTAQRRDSAAISNLAKRLKGQSDD